mmetsp:Transcript_29/g.76  ORF Transcript_29/g.76 Transcript_29/m.76 type:complete len:91 (+) Transcript_29:232-504(+)
MIFTISQNTTSYHLLVLFGFGFVVCDDDSHEHYTDAKIELTPTNSLQTTFCFVFQKVKTSRIPQRKEEEISKPFHNDIPVDGKVLERTLR